LYDYDDKYESTNQFGEHRVIYTRRRRSDDVDCLDQKRVTFDGKNEQRSVTGPDVKGCLWAMPFIIPVKRSDEGSKSNVHLRVMNPRRAKERPRGHRRKESRRHITTGPVPSAIQVLRCGRIAVTTL
jgi:hypothetical protein